MMQQIIYEHPSVLGKAVKTISNSFLFKFYKNIYLIGIHHGYPFLYININDECIKSTEFNISKWNEILFKPTENTLNQFVFNHFSQKQIDLDNIYYSDTKRFKYIKKHYFPINMFPGNPKNLYYVMECLNSTVNNGDSGSPIYDKNKKLIGVISKIKNNHIFVIPIIYICYSIKKKNNNNIYTIQKENPKNINMYKIVNNNIYHPSLKTYIDKDTYIVLEGDDNKDIIIDNIKEKYKIYNNNINNNNFIITNNKIVITTGLLNILKLINQDLLLLIFRNFKSKQKITFLKYEFYFN